MPRENVKLFLPMLILVPLSLLTWANFQKYQPKILKGIEEVKGTNVEESNIPCTNDCRKISLSQTQNSELLVFKTKKTPQETQDFYKNIYLKKGWKVETKAETQNSLVSKYKKDSTTVTIISSYQEETKLTVTSVEVSQAD